MLASQPIILHLPLASMSLPSLDFAPKSVPNFRNLLKVVHPSFLLPIFEMLFALSQLDRQTCHSSDQGTHQYSQPIFIYHHSMQAFEENWYESCGQVQTPFALSQASQGLVGLCYGSQRFGLWRTGRRLFGQMRPKSIA